MNKKIEVPPATELLAYLTLISTLFALEGFFYVWTFYREFGIDTGLYFSLSDYITVSLNNILSLIGMITVYVVMCLGPDLLLPVNKNNYYVNWKYPCLISAGLLVLLLSFIFGRYDFLIFYAVFVITFLTLNKICNEIKNEFLYWVVHIFVCFSAFLCVLAIYNAEDIKRNPSVTYVNFEKDLSVEGLKESRFIGANSQYVFILSGDGKSSLAISRDHVDSLKTIIKQNTKLKFPPVS